MRVRKHPAQRPAVFALDTLLLLLDLRQLLHYPDVQLDVLFFQLAILPLGFLEFLILALQLVLQRSQFLRQVSVARLALLFFQLLFESAQLPQQKLVLAFKAPFFVDGL